MAYVIKDKKYVGQSQDLNGNWLTKFVVKINCGTVADIPEPKSEWDIADVVCYDKSGNRISSKLVCCTAQDIGFGGIANMDIFGTFTYISAE